MMRRLWRLFEAVIVALFIAVSFGQALWGAARLLFG